MRRPLLLPLVPLYAAGLALREWRLERGWERVRRLRWPVVSVGNVSAGGSGKTPLVIALVRLLRERGWSVDVLSRGYGRVGQQAARVLVDGTAEEFGDEPLLIARKAGVPVWVAAERFEAGRLAESEKQKDEGRPRVHILDDGFQHRQLARDVDVVLVNDEDLHDSLLPAGNLREPVKALNRSTVIAIPAGDRQVEQYLSPAVSIDRNSGGSRWHGPLWRVRRRMDVPQVDGPVAAFCGIARAEQFFAGLESAGLRIVVKQAFADHHPFTASDVESLIAKAQASGAMTLITTEKDEVRLGKLMCGIPDSLELQTVSLTLEIEDETVVGDWLLSRLDASRLMSAL